MELRGSASITGGTGFGSLRAMEARDINLDYADDGRTVQHVTLSGAGEHHARRQRRAGRSRGSASPPSSWTSRSGPTAPSRTWSAASGCVVSLPAQGAAPARTIRADELTGDGASRCRPDRHALHAATWTSARAARRSTPPTRAGEVGHADAGALERRRAERANFGGDTTFEDGSLTATAAEARYLMAKTASCSSASPGAAPRVTDTGLQVEATDIAIGLATNAVSATGAVSSVMQPAAARAAAPAPPARRRCSPTTSRSLRAPPRSSTTARRVGPPTPAGPGCGRAPPTSAPRR